MPNANLVKDKWSWTHMTEIILTARYVLYQDQVITLFEEFFWTKSLKKRESSIPHWSNLLRSHRIKAPVVTNFLPLGYVKRGSVGFFKF